MAIFSNELCAALDELRRRQHAERAALTPLQRLARAEEIRAFGRAGGAPRSTSDEPLELWLTLIRRWKAARPG